MIRISVVSYLNSMPFIYGLRKSCLINHMMLELDYPSICASKIINSEVDVGLVPVVTINQMNSLEIISDYCISSEGKVDTVCLFSNLPIEDINTIYLDYQSRTSIELLKILLKAYWKINPCLLNSKIGFEEKINNNEAVLVIGDRAFNLRNKYRFNYDLSEIWYKLTGLPFVFAVWVTNKKLDKNFITDFNSALSYGVNSIKNNDFNFQYNKMEKEYLSSRILYKLDKKKKEAMNLFLSKINYS